MRLFKRRICLLLAACAVLYVPLFGEVAVVHINLEQMVQQADKVFRGTVVDITEGTVWAGGGELPTVTYRLEVSESFKGDFTVVREDVRIVDVQIVGTLKKKSQQDDYEQFSILPELPKLKLRREYLLLTTAPSAIGLSTTVGLGQGNFKVFSRNKEEWAVNEHDNLGLFNDMNVEGFPTQGPVSYLQLADLITTLTTTGE